MKKILSFLGLFLLLLDGQGQDLSVVATPTYNDLLRFNSMPENPDLHVKPGFSVSIQYDKSTGGGFYFGPGLTYQYAHVGIAPDSTRPEDITDTRARLMHLNIRLGFPLGDDYFLTADPFLEYQFNRGKAAAMEDQSGLGLSVGVVKKFYQWDNLFIVVEPRIWFHSLIPFSAQEPRMPLTVAGINLGLGFYE